MKVKMLVALVASGLLAASLAYAAPSTLNTQLADDATSSQPPANDASQNVGAMDNNTAVNPGAATDTNMPSAATGDANNANSGSDEDTQDTASGDSDY